MIQVIERFHQIMELVAAATERPYHISEIAEKLDVSVQTAANIVKTMTELGYLYTPGKRRGYVFGPQLYHLCRHDPFRQLVEIAKPEALKLAVDLNGLSVLCCAMGEQRICLFRGNGNTPLPYDENSPVGTDFFGTTTGITLLAYMHEEQLRHFWQSQNGTANIFNISNYEEFKSLCARIRAKGFLAWRHEDNLHPGLHRVNIAAPVRYGHEQIAALGVTIPSVDPETENRDLSFTDELCAAAHRIEQNMNAEYFIEP